MDRISSADRLLLLLRQRLMERARGKNGAARTEAPSGAISNAQVDGQEAVLALASIEAVDDRQLGRALLQSILADHFGGHLINDAKFQQVVERVVQALEGDAGMARLLSQAVNDLRASSR